MYWDFILGALAIVWIYFFVIKEKKFEFSLNCQKLCLILRPYLGIVICVFCFILGLCGLNIDITNGAKKVCIIIMILAIMCVICKIARALDYNDESVFVITAGGTFALCVVMYWVFQPEFDSCFN